MKVKVLSLEFEGKRNFRGDANRTTRLEQNNSLDFHNTQDWCSFACEVIVCIFASSPHRAEACRLQLDQMS